MGLTDFQPVDSNFKEKVQDSFTRQAFMETLGASLVDISPGFCEIHLPYKRELTQQDGYFHAGVVGTIADNAGGYAAFSLMPANTFVLTVEYKLNLMLPACGDYLVARGRVIKPGRTLTICLSEVFGVKDGQEKLCAVATVTLMCLQKS